LFCVVGFLFRFFSFVVDEMVLWFGADWPYQSSPHLGKIECMSEQPDGMDAVSAALAQIDAGVDALQAAVVSSVSSLGLTDSVRRLETLMLRAQSGSRALVGEMDRRGVAAELFATSTADILRQLLNLDPRAASARVRQAREWTPRVAVTGELLEPLFAHVAAALDAREISVAHARIISDTRTALPAEIDTLHGDAVEALLVEHALTLHPKDLRAVAQRLIDTLNPDEAFTDDADQQRRRDFRLIDNPDGSSTPAGRFTPELTALIRPALDALSAPQPAGDIPDTRTAGQRRHDAIAEALTLSTALAAFPTPAGSRSRSASSSPKTTSPAPRAVRPSSSKTPTAPRSASTPWPRSPPRSRSAPSP